MARGVPVLQAWALGVIRALQFRRRIRPDFYRDYYAQGAWLAQEGQSLPVLLETRISFEKAFGISPEEQIRLESGFADVHISSDYRTVDVLRFDQWRDVVGVHETWDDA